MSAFAILLAGTFSAFAQNIRIEGTVTDQNGEPIPGVTVVVKYSSNGSFSDSNGKYTITAPSDGTLVFSSIGYYSMEVEIDGKTDISAVLTADQKVLDDAIVVAYGTVRRSAFTGSASVVNSEAIENPSASFDKGLQGKIAGVQVVSSSGQPGSATTFRIRGAGSLTASNEPLYVIDGVAMSAYSQKDVSEIADSNYGSVNIMASLNPNDIESITVLKDAAAAALYGSRAANGVVMITTKSGSGKTKVNFNATHSWASLGKGYDMANSADIYKMYFNGYLDQGLSVADANARTQGALTHNPYNVDNPLDASGNVVSGASLVVDTDWQDAVFNTAQTQSYSISVSGGHGNTNYFFSAGYLDQDGIAIGGNYKRYSGKMNISSEPSKWLKVGMNSTFSYSIQHGTVEGQGGSGMSPIHNALTFSSAIPIYVVDANGNLVLDAAGKKQFNFVNPNSRDFNPLFNPIEDNTYTKVYNVLLSAYADITFFKGFDFKTTFSPGLMSTDEHRYWNKYHGNGPAYNGRLDKYHHVDLNYTWNNIFTYDTKIGQQSNLNLMAGSEYWQSTFETLYAGGRGLQGNFEELDAASGSFSPGSNTTKETMISYLGRAEYSYTDRYNLSASIRTDGSSVFGSANKWGIFWSAGASWRISQESFMQNTDWVDNLKLRLSYGTSGNKAGIGRYAALGLWSASSKYLYGDNAGIGHEQFANALLSWEKQNMFNVGLDFSLWDSRIYGSIDWFNKNSDGLLYDYPLALSSSAGSWGVASITMNAAKTANRGLEIVLASDDILRSSQLRWDVQFNASIIRDEIKDLNGKNNVPMTSTQKIWSVGGSQYEFWMPTWAGVDTSNGNPLWYHVDGNGNRSTTSNYAEATYERQGRSTPTVYGGLTNTLRWKGFDFSLDLYYAIGGKFFDAMYQSLMNDGSSVQQIHKDALNAWTAAGQSTNVPKFVVGNTSQSNSLSTRFLFNGTHVQVKNITLGYTLPANLGPVSNVIRNARVYATASNLASWFADKDYKGYNDVDLFGVQGYTTGGGIPNPRTFTFGVDVTF